MSEQTTPSEQPYDPKQDPDADPEQLTEKNKQPDQAEGENDTATESPS
ncbi:MAG TPA: hypothetical protein VK046_07945 [Actinomycetaceae bacterium]|nr:hypothetical protein [Actinomycetaceae bacterium]